jgi:signal peptidase
MEPAFYRGDLLLLTNHHEEPIRAGDIVVFRIEGRDIPIVHRVLKVHEKYIYHLNFFAKENSFLLIIEMMVM